MVISDNKATVLVTGGNGFLGIHCIAQLLQQGYTVRTTIRNAARKKETAEMLNNAGITDQHRLTFVEADLMDDENWQAAVTDCTYVLHVASPIFLRLPKQEDEMIRPAVEGTLRVLRAARNAGVKRVVMTSNFGAVGYSLTDRNTLITEESWTSPDQKGLSAYNRSKVLAEHAAWDFIKKEGGNLELSVINPMAIFGPAFGPALSSGFELLKKLMDGTIKAIPRIVLGIVDVRDVADLHIRAMTDPAAKGQRFLALAGGTLSLPQIAMLLKKTFPETASRISGRIAPNWMIRLAALFNKQAKAIAPLLGVYRNASNEKARRLLGWRPRSNEEAVLATAGSLLKYHFANA